MASSALTKARDKIARLQQSSKRAREKAGEVVENFLITAETAGTAFAFGVGQGKVGTPEDFKVAGVPVDLGAGLLFHAAAAFGVGRGMECHFRAIGNGALSSYAQTLGRGVGAEWKLKSLSGIAGAGSLPPRRGGGGISQEDLADLAVDLAA